MVDRSPDIKQRAMFVTSSAKWRWNKVILAELKEENPLAAIVVATEQSARWEPVCHPPDVDGGTGKHACSAGLHHSGVLRDITCPSRPQKS